MKNLIKTIVLAVALTFLGPVIGHAAEACKTHDTAFYKHAEDLKAKVFIATDKARTEILSRINAARVDAGMEPFNVDTLAIGIFEYQGQVYAGTVMFKKHCVVEGTVKTFPVDQFIGFLEQIGLSIQDFKPQVGA